MFKFLLRVSPEGSTYNRTYIKFDEILAKIDGVVTLYLMAIAIILGPLEKFHYYKGFIDKIK